MNLERLEKQTLSRQKRYQDNTMKQTNTDRMLSADFCAEIFITFKLVTLSLSIFQHGVCWINTIMDSAQNTSDLARTLKWSGIQ